MGNYTQKKMTAAERAEYENMLASMEKLTASIDYIAALDYPEIFDEEEALDENDL